MNNLTPIVLGVGLQDGVNPCIFMTCAFFIIHGLWIRSGSLRMMWYRIIFGLVYALCTFVCNFGPVQIFIFQKWFILFAKILYFFLGVGAFVLGALFLKDWFLLRRGLPAEDLTDKKIKNFPSRALVVVPMTVLPAVLLSAIATLWPINTYLMLLGNSAIIKGQWHMVLSLLSVYVLAIMWPLWLVWAFLSIKNLRPSLFKIICAAIFFIASTTVIFIFK